MKDQAITIQISPSTSIDGTLSLPQDKVPIGMCIFAHGSGSSRFSPRNKYVADILHHYGIGTLLLDLLTKTEEAQDEYTRHFRFDINLLTERVVSSIDFLSNDENLKHLPIAVFGASTGAAAALGSAHHRPQIVSCVVSRGGRPDLINPSVLETIHTPTLLIVGGNDPVVLGMNRQAYDSLASKNKMIHVVPHATHLFEEPGTLDQAAHKAAEFMIHHFPKVKEE